MPATPDINFIHLYSKDKAGVAELFYKNDAGVERDLSNPLAHAQIHDINGADHTGFPLGVTKGGTGTITQFTPGSVIFAGASGVYSHNNPKFFWDDVDFDLRLGVNANPSPTLEGRGFVLVKETVAAELDVYGFLGGQSAVLRTIIGRGTVASPSQALSGDLSEFMVNARTPTAYSGRLAGVRLMCAENITDVAMGTRIVFYTTPIGGVAPGIDRFEVGTSGQWGIGSPSSFGTAGQYKRSGGALAAPSWSTIALSELSPRDHATLTAIGANDHHTENHKARHVVGGADPFVGGDLLDATARVTVRKNTGADIGARRRLNLIEGANITLTVVDDVAGEEVDVTVAAAGGGGSVNIKQAELDFGSAHNIKEGMFTIVDADVLAGSQINMVMAYDAPTGKVQDETEMDDFVCRCAPDGAGQFKTYISSLYGSVTGLFKFNYLVG